MHHNDHFFSIFVRNNLSLRFFISIFIIFTIAVRPVLPLVNYAVNYEYIVKNLCEKRGIPQSTCRGKCYVGKELAKTEKQSASNQNLKLSGLDVFVSNEILSYADMVQSDALIKNPDSDYMSFHTSGYFSRIFHPPLA